MYGRVAGLFARSEPRARAGEYVSGLVAGLERGAVDGGLPQVQRI